MLSITEIEQINQKLNPELALSLSLDNAKRMESSLLHSGFSPSTDMWKLILFYNGSLEEIKKVISFSFIPLLGNFAILFIKEKDIPSFLTFPQVLYVELSRPIYENALTGIDASCFPDYNIVTGRNVNTTTLTGKGTAIAVLDSGVDYRHPDFRNADGSTRILAYWDQSLPFASFNKENTNSNSSNSDNFQYISTTNSQNNYIAADNRTNTRRNNFSNHSSTIDNPYNLGVIFSEEDLNRLLMPKSSSAPSDSSTFSVTVPATELLSPSEDISGHGTHIAGICSGNGRASNGNNQGVAPESSLIVVKLKNETASVYTDYANLMMAVDFAVRFANSRSLPLSINISYGSNDGSHTGSSLLELFMEQVSLYGKNVICAATGNEGLSRRHASLNTISNQNTYDKSIDFTVAPGERSLYLEIWQAFADDFSYELFAPSGLESFVFPAVPGIYAYMIADTTIYLTINNPTPYQPFRQYFLSFSSNTTFITSGTWALHIASIPTGKIVDGRLQFWLPSKEATNSATGFLSPSSDMTFTIPSTASSVISVSGYDSNLDVFAPFSGQGFSNNRHTKPDLCAPAVNILSTAPGGGYTIRTGTSMAAPFVTGAAALLMQHGIVNGNDPFLYGEKAKAYLWKSARPLPAFSEYPNEKVGWGALCFK
nr:S8 family peptidase [uncultured Anaerobutyricum sp.]